MQDNANNETKTENDHEQVESAKKEENIAKDNNDETTIESNENSLKNNQNENSSNDYVVFDPKERNLDENNINPHIDSNYREEIEIGEIVEIKENTEEQDKKIYSDEELGSRAITNVDPSNPNPEILYPNDINIDLDGEVNEKLGSRKVEVENENDPNPHLDPNGREDFELENNASNPNQEEPTVTKIYSDEELGSKLVTDADPNNLNPTIDNPETINIDLENTEDKKLGSTKVDVNDASNLNPFIDPNKPEDISIEEEGNIDNNEEIANSTLSTTPNNTPKDYKVVDSLGDMDPELVEEIEFDEE